MQIIRSIEEVQYEKNSVITVGTFDGIHLAHQKIINEVVSQAKRHNSRSVIVTFDPHPREIVASTGGKIKLLTTLEERQDLCDKLGIDIFIVLRFDKGFSQLGYQEFYRRYLVGSIGVRIVIEGYNHHWGKNREGNIESLAKIGKEFNFEVISIGSVMTDGVPVNSSIIRDQLNNGDVENAGKFLGRPYKLQGKVIYGDKRGKSLGFPTANVKPDSPDKLVPMKGIYFVKVAVDNIIYFGMASIGIRPTFETGGNLTIEVNILDFNMDIYGKTIDLYFLNRLRDELKFDSAEKLVLQMEKDREKSIELRKEYLRK
jgi:riboflavin kinase / FMN adenylyltransferase